jgi:hypothetical protein
LIVVLLALNVVAWGSELLGLGDSGIPEVLAREDALIGPLRPVDVGLRAPVQAPSQGALRVPTRLELDFTELRSLEERNRVAQELSGQLDYRELVAALRDDEIPGNASKALRILSRCDNRILPLLEGALDSDDHQQRQLAAIVLRDRVDEPSARLLEVSLEALRIDDLPQDRWRITKGAENAGHATNYLLPRLPAVADRLIANLSSEDRQERFLSAYLLARGRDARAAPRVCEILIEHLRDNQLFGDAALSADALYQYGMVARPYLIHAELHADEQAHGLLRLLQYDRSRALDSDAARRERRKQHRWATEHYDPVIPADPGRIMGHNPPQRWERDQGGC